MTGSLAKSLAPTLAPNLARRIRAAGVGRIIVSFLAVAGAVFAPAFAQTVPVAGDQIAAQTIARSAVPAPTPAGSQSRADADAPIPGLAPARAANEGPARVRLEGPVVIVNDEAISRNDVRLRARLAMASSGIEPSAEAFGAISSQVLEGLIDEKLQMAEAGRRKIEVTEKDVDEALADIARSNNNQTPEALTSELRRLGVNPRTLRDQLRADFAWQNLVQGRYGARIRVGESEMDAMMDQMKHAASLTQYLVSEILVAYNGPNDIDRATNFAQRLIDDMRNGAPLDVTARQFSAAPTAAAGGDLGWVNEDDLRPEIVAFLNQMQPGDVSAPIVTPGGIYVMVLRNRREGQGEHKVVGLKQIIASISPDLNDEQKADLLVRINLARDRIKTCDDFNASVNELADLVVVDLGENAEEDLKTEFRAAIAGLEVNQLSQPFLTEGAVHVVGVCSLKVDQTIKLPERSEIENRLFNQQLQALAASYLRDLRRSAAIIRK